ncbi:MAG: hypothetical protein RCG15_03705 [Candidatus Rickettsia vulgarisii]
MVKEWVQQQGEDLIAQIQNGKFYHGLSNDISPNTLPVLQAPNTIDYGVMKILLLVQYYFIA